MAEPQAWDLVVIGAGMAGISTAIWARRLGLSALLLEREREPGGQLTAIAGRIVDYPGLDLPEGAALTERLIRQARELGADIRLGAPVLSVDLRGRTCTLAGGQVVTGRSLVLATGLTAKRLDIPGEAELYQQRLVRRPSHDMAWFSGKRVAIIGGGDRAAENALMLSDTAAWVHLIHRGRQLRARATFADSLSQHERISVHLNAHVQSFTVGGGQATIALEQDGNLVRLPVDGVCIYIGNRPNTELAAGQVALTDEGYIVTDRTGQTTVPGVYAAGDVCTLPSFQALVTAAGQAMMVAKQIAMRQRP